MCDVFQGKKVKKNAYARLVKIPNSYAIVVIADHHNCLKRDWRSFMEITFKAIRVFVTIAAISETPSF